MLEPRHRAATSVEGNKLLVAVGQSQLDGADQPPRPKTAPDSFHRMMLWHCLSQNWTGTVTPEAYACTPQKKRSKRPKMQRYRHSYRL